MYKSMSNLRLLTTASVLLLTLVATGCACRGHERVGYVEHAMASDIDSDGDGVVDRLDRCPNTPRGFEVNSEGCIVEQTVILRTVNFEYKSDRLTEPARDSLDRVAAALIGQPSLYVQVSGHTDSIGSERYNQRLSEMRAQSVRSYLISKGVSSRNLQARGYGESKPIASNDTAEGRTENRRVEFAVLNKPAHVNVEPKDSSMRSKAAAQH